MTGKPLEEFMRDTFFKPLGLKRTTWATPSQDNFANAHITLSDGTPFEVPNPRIGNGSLLCGAAGLKSTVHDLLILYDSLLSALSDQRETGLASTPGSPFKEVVTLFTSYNKKGNTEYGLGWFLTELPNDIGWIGINDGRVKQNPVIGRGVSPTSIAYHNGNMPGYISSVHLVPSTHTAIVILGNTLSFADLPDYVGGLILNTILGSDDKVDFVSLVRECKASSINGPLRTAAQLESERKEGTSHKPLDAYVGRYSNAMGNLVLAVSVSEDGDGLRMRLNDLPGTYYDLKHYHDDVFAWACNRDAEAKRAMFPQLSADFRRITFQAGEDGTIKSIFWVYARDEPKGERQIHLLFFFPGLIPIPRPGPDRFPSHLFAGRDPAMSDELVYQLNEFIHRNSKLSHVKRGWKNSDCFQLIQKYAAGIPDDVRHAVDRRDSLYLPERRYHTYINDMGYEEMSDQEDEIVDGKIVDPREKNADKPAEEFPLRDQFVKQQGRQAEEHAVDRQHANKADKRFTAAVKVPSKMVITATMSFLERLELDQREKPFQLFVNLPPDAKDDRQSNLIFEDVSVKLRDIRKRDVPPSLDDQGFTVRNFVSSVEYKDINRREVVERDYYAEMEALPKEEDPSIHQVFFFDWQVRSTDKEANHEKLDLNDSTEFILPAMSVRVDQSPTGVLHRILPQLGDDAAELLQGRVRIIDLWKPLLFPVEDHPLAVCDGSTVPAKDLVPSDNIRQSFQGESYMVHFSEAQEWYYLSGHRPDEVLMLTMFDSDPAAKAKCQSSLPAAR
ncbi:uncharacterized protein E0L32_007015 [Thyridium curvatum]|uniref:Uncharacterized protein n=1 Tax=Thyridium curvatum TaxID=1093900 RepID=A0A507B6A7_9PEZI|nr:uncharacterized protein E0L32_007015 [Thyridium curvatum]TPX12368.1 hypothetical protein E0L32_007015 [Thyridium curvatum]